MLGRKLRFGMVGGGRGAFIGGVHRIVAVMDGEAELVAGALSSDAERSRESGAALRLDPNRVYESYAQMARLEGTMPANRRLDFVTIVTPNDTHLPIAKAFLEAGFNVVLDKPLALNVAEGLELREAVQRSRKVFVLTHNYSGHPLVKQARSMVREGTLGEIRKVVVEYSQGWLATALENSGNKQAAWRMDPARSGPSSCVADIGTHAEHLARYVTGLKIAELCAELTTFVPGRGQDDDAAMLLRFAGGAKGVLQVSQVAAGEDNNLSLRVYGSEGSLQWRQEQCDELIVSRIGRPEEIWRRGAPYLGEAARAASRVPAGHPEGYLEAFANVYREAFRAIRAEVLGQPIPADADFPNIDDGVAGMQFVEAALRSARGGGIWTSLVG